MVLKESDFGPGDAGRRARAYLETEPPCEECKEPGAEVVLDYDVIGDLSQAALHLKCLEIAKSKIAEDLEKTRRTTTFGINGHGRA